MTKGLDRAKRVVAHSGGHAHQLFSRIWLPSPPQYIFLLSHMRARTSLLSHILGSSPEIGCYVEQHLSYDNLHHLRKLHWRYVSQTSSFWPRRFLFDKLLNVKLRLGDSVLASQATHFIFMIRQPKPSISSTLSNTPWLTMNQSVEYYEQRLTQLAETAERLHFIAKPYLYFDADELVNSTAQTFTKIQNHLGLTEPLSERYTVRKLTGKRGGYGDLSENIKAGSILKTVKSPEANIPVRDLERCDALYQSTREKLLTLGSSLSSGSDGANNTNASGPTLPEDSIKAPL